MNNKKKTYLSLFVTAFTFFILCFLFIHEVYAIDVNKKTLQNGLVVLHSESHNLPIVMVTLLIKASPLNEPREKAGLANLTAELLTEGTKNRSSIEISEEIEFIGASIDVTVFNDYTTISLSVLKKDVEKGFELFSDILLNPIFPEEEIKRKKMLLKGILKNREEDPAFLAERAFKKEVFGDHPYGRLTEGSVDTLDAIKRDDLNSFYTGYFLPNNSILSVAGDLTEEELNSLIERHLKNWKKSTLPSIVNRKVNVNRIKKTVQIDRDLTQANILLGHIGISRDNPDYYAVAVMNYILGGGGLSSRLMQKIREEKGLAYDVNSAFIYNKETGLFQIEVQTKNETANSVISEIINQINNIRQNPVSDMELSEAKSYLTGSFLRRLDTHRGIADFFALVEFYNLGLDYVEKYSSYINSITREDILRVAQKYLDAENYIIVVVADKKKASIKY
ncbi:MAG: M16 family metallopeptidase [Thermodesulfovibrionales bacterium]